MMWEGWFLYMVSISLEAELAEDREETPDVSMSDKDGCPDLLQEVWRW